MWKKKPLIDEVNAKLARIEYQRDLDQNPNAVYPGEVECKQALRWLKGENVSIDFKIESRQRDGKWVHSLLHGSLGFSAASPLVVITPDGIVL